MSLVDFRVRLGATEPGCEPAVRAWVDLEPQLSFESELELPLRRIRGSEWTAALSVSDKSPPCFLYRLGLAAHPGAVWSLTVRHRGLARDILIDGDTLALAKCWLVGVCRIPLAPPLRRGRVQGSDGRRIGTALPAQPDPLPHPAATVIALDQYRCNR